MREGEGPAKRRLSNELRLGGSLALSCEVDYDLRVSRDPDRLDPQHLDYTSSSTPKAEREDSASFFGYIGLGIAVAAMLVGLVGMVLFVLYFLRA